MAKAMKKVGMDGREQDSIPAEVIVEGKGVHMRKFLTSWLLAVNLSTDEKLKIAFDLADANGDGHIDREYAQRSHRPF